MLKPEDDVTVYMRPGCHVCARVKNFLTEHDVPYRARDVDADPLTPRELWDLFNRKASRLRVPFTALNDGEDVVLGFDPQRLEGVFVHGELGGVQVSSVVTDPVRYDEYTSADIDGSLWTAYGSGDGASGTPGGGPDLDTGAGRLTVSGAAGDVSVVSTRRFGTPPGSQIGCEVQMSVELASRAPTLGPPLGELSLCDLPTGIVLGFEVTNDVIVAVHRRSGPPGVAAESEHFSHRVLTDAPTGPGKAHQFRITYQHDTSRAQWYVDGRCVFSAISPHQMEGVSLGMGLRAGSGSGDVDPAQPGLVSWAPWRIEAIAAPVAR